MPAPGFTSGFTSGFTWGFTEPSDSRSDSSLAANGGRLSVVVSGLIQLDSSTGLPSMPHADRAPAAAPSTRFALVTSRQRERFHPEVIRRLGETPGALALTAARVASLATSAGYRGLILDFETQGKADLPALLSVVGAMADSARAHGVAFVGMMTPAGDTAAYPTRAFVPLVDAVVVLLLDEHRATSAPGPIATPIWVRRMLGQRVSEVGAEHIVAVLPAYAYLWRTNQPAETLSFADARRVVAQANVELVRDPASRSLHAVKPGEWDLWISDAELLRALLAETSSLGVSRIALWRLGLEDSALWSTSSTGARASPASRKPLRTEVPSPSPP